MFLEEDAKNQASDRFDNILFVSLWRNIFFGQKESCHYLSHSLVLHRYPTVYIPIYFIM